MTRTHRLAGATVLLAAAIGAVLVMGAVAAAQESEPLVPDPGPRVPTKVSREEHLRTVIRQDAETAVRLVPRMLELAPDIDEGLAYDTALAVARSCRNKGVRPELFLALIKVESDYDPNCRSATNDHGLSQLHARPVYDVQDNIAAGVAELAEAIEAEGSERAGLARYNGGPRKPGVSWGYADRVLALAGEGR